MTVSTTEPEVGVVGGSQNGSPQPSLTADARSPIERRVLYLPIAVVLAYLVVTSLLFAFGPWLYSLRSGLVYVYLVAAHLALVLGYLIGARGRAMPDRWRWSPSRMVTVGLVVTGALLLPTSLHNAGSLIPDVIAGLRDPGGAYLRSVALTQAESTLTLVSYIRVLAGPALFLLWPLTIFYWRRLGVVVRTLSVACVLFTIATFIAMGTNKSIVDILLIFPWIALAAYVSGRLPLSRRWIAGLAAGWVVAMTLGLSFFVSTQISRSGSTSVYGVLPAATPLVGAPRPTPTSGTPSATPAPTATASPALLARVDYDNVLVRFTPEGRLRVGVIGFDSYVTQGYYALSLALEKPFVPMWGVGNSFFATRQAARLIGRDDIIELPYPMRLRVDGWDPYGQWSSVYPWIASDVSFPGSILVIFAIGVIFALAWRDALGGNNPFAVVMVALLIIMLFYFPANNQVLQFGEGFVAFWCIFALWMLSRRGSFTRR